MCVELFGSLLFTIFWFFENEQFLLLFDKKNFKDEDWLKELEEGLKQNASLTTFVCTILDDFKDRIEYLSNTVNSLYNKTSTVQLEQQSNLFFILFCVLAFFFNIAIGKFHLN